MTDLSPFQAPAPPPLVDVDGRPLRTAAPTLTREIAGPSMAGIRSIFSGHPAQGLTPVRLAQILRAAETGNATSYLELAEEMEEKDLHYLSVLGTRKRAVSQLPINVEAASEDPNDEADAALIRDWLKRLTLQDELFHILDAVGKGYSCTEIVWRTGDLWLPEELIWQDPRFFEFDKVTGRKLLLRGDDGVPVPLQPHKFIVHMAPAKSGLPIRGGLARAAAWSYLFKNYTIKDWMAFLEVYGLPLRVGKYQPGTTEDDIRKLEQAVAQIGSDAGAVIPQSMMIEFVNSGGGTASADMFDRKAQYCDDQVSKAVLGQTSSADAKASGIGSGQADLHGEVRHDIETADAVQLSATLTRDLGIPMVMFNRGKRKNYPLILVGRPDPVDVKQALEAMDKGVELGVPIAVSTYRKLTGIPEPKPEEELLNRPTSNSPQGAQEDAGGAVGAGKGAPALLGPLKSPQGANRKAGEDVAAAVKPSPVRDDDPIALAADEALGDWEKLIQGVTGPIEQLVQGASSLAEVKAGLIGALDQMDDDQMVEMLARAGFGARLQGDIDARPDEDA